jgi:hypothetical protein
MAINTTQIEANLTTKLNATTGTTEGKEFLLLGKAVEALTPTVTVNSVITEGTTQVGLVNTAGTTQVGLVNTEGTTQVAAVQAAAAVYAPLADPTFTGTVNAAALTLSGNLTVNGTTTTVNSTTLDVADLNITIADGAADAAAANGAGITVDGASATMLYTSATDTWDFNKAVTGTYTNLHPVVNTNTTVTGATTFDMNKPMHHFDMTGAASFTGVNIAAGKTAMMVLDTSATPHTPSWGSDIKWPEATEPAWANSRYWIVSFTCLDGAIILASASGYTV